MKILNEVILLTVIIPLMLLAGCKKEYQPPKCNYIIYFPDTAFKNALLDIMIEEGDDYRRLDENQDGEICDGEAKRVKELYLYNKGISDLTGIQEFSNLKILDCDRNSFDTLALQLNSLQDLNCNNNSITHLDVSNLPNLRSLSCIGNKLQEIDISKNINLKSLSCLYNELNSIDVSKNKQLEYISIKYNNISFIDLSNQIYLQQLSINNNNISTLDLSNNVELSTISIMENPISQINLSNNLKLVQFVFGNNNLERLDISKNINLTTLVNGGDFNLAEICVWTLPFPPESGYYYIEGIPNSAFVICD